MTGYRDFETDITVQANQKVTVKTALTPASITAEAPELKWTWAPLSLRWVTDWQRRRGLVTIVDGRNENLRLVRRGNSPQVKLPTVWLLVLSMKKSGMCIWCTTFPDSRPSFTSIGT